MAVLALVALDHGGGLRFVVRDGQHRQPARGDGGADAGPVGPARRARAGRAADGQGRQSRSGPVLGQGRSAALRQCRAALPRRPALPRLRVRGRARWRRLSDRAAPRRLRSGARTWPRSRPPSRGRCCGSASRFRFTYLGKLRERDGPLARGWPVGPAARRDPSRRGRGSGLARSRCRCGSRALVLRRRAGAASAGGAGCRGDEVGCGSVVGKWGGKAVWCPANGGAGSGPRLENEATGQPRHGARPAKGSGDAGGDGRARPASAAPPWL